MRLQKLKTIRHAKPLEIVVLNKPLFLFSLFFFLCLAPATGSAYERDIYWGFSNNPVGSGYPLPGATYGGTHDSSVGGVDSFGMTGYMG